MNQTYLYRKHLRTPLSFLMIYAGAFMLGIALLTFGFFLTDKKGVDAQLGIIISVVLLFTFVVVAIEFTILYFVLFRRFQSISVTLTEDTIIYTNAKSRKIIPYRDIVSLQFPSMKYAGGWVKINYHGGTIRLTVVLEEIGDFISKLKEKLDEKGMAQCYNEKKLFSFYKTAVFSDESWDRVYRYFKSYILISYLSIIVDTIILRFSNVEWDNKALIFGSLLAPLTGLVLSEILIGRKVRRRADRDKLTLLPREKSFEQKAYAILVPLCTCIYSVILMLCGIQ